MSVGWNLVIAVWKYMKAGARLHRARVWCRVRRIFRHDEVPAVLGDCTIHLQTAITVLHFFCFAQAYIILLEIVRPTRDLQDYMREFRMHAVLN